VDEIQLGFMIREAVSRDEKLTNFTENMYTILDADVPFQKRALKIPTDCAQNTDNEGGGLSQI
jgi:hypothetical protein